MLIITAVATVAARRTPQGVRGLKCISVRGAGCPESGRTPQGGRGLKSDGAGTASAEPSRTPQGVRGLKWAARPFFRCAAGVAPRKGCVD